MKPSLSIISCACGRLDSFAFHLRCLADQAGAKDAEYCIGLWGDPAEHIEILDRYADRFKAIKHAHIVTEKYWPLPYAYNAALKMAKADRVLIIGAEIVAPADAVSWASAFDPNDMTAWFAACSDEDSGTVYVGPSSKGAFPYCVALPRAPLAAIGGWDEKFAEGIVFDDVDLAARLLLAGVRFRWDFAREAVHQSHIKIGHETKDMPRGKYRAVNRAELERRLKGIPVLDIWPIWWPDGTKPEFPADDGLARQGALAARLRRVGYPMKAVG